MQLCMTTLSARAWTYATACRHHNNEHDDTLQQAVKLETCEFETALHWHWLLEKTLRNLKEFL